MSESSEMDTKTPQDEEIKEEILQEDLKAASEAEPEQEAAADDSKEGGSEEKPDEATEWKTKAAYLAAEMENMTKRFQREKSDLIRFANEGLLQKIVPVMDNLILALKAAKNVENDSGANEKAFAQMVEGVEMTLKHFEDTLKMQGVEFIETVEKEFDPSLHEAVGQSSDQEKKDNSITEEFQRGFKLNGRVVRAAKVIVNKV